MLQGLLTDIQNILIRRTITEPLGDAITGFTQNLGGGNFFGDIFGSIFGGFRAAGGPVNAGKAYVVGERGPELFMPSSAGSIIPNGATMGGGAGAVNVIINNNAGAEVSQSTRNTGDGVELTVMIDQAVSENINRPGSRTSEALKTFSNRSLVRR